jgi:hypothetical protein
MHQVNEQVIKLPTMQQQVNKRMININGHNHHRRRLHPIFSDLYKVLLGEEITQSA